MLATYATARQPNVVHVQPCGDLIEHSDGFACVCGPIVEAMAVGLVCESGASSTHVGWLVTHHALDGRA